ncbi:MAG TPA: hypothetical protein VGD56_11190, partial [Gemmatirosa sp.]
GVTDDRAIGKAARGLEVVHARTHDAAEAVETLGMRAFEAARRRVAGSTLDARLAERPLVAVAAAVGLGALAGAMLGGSRGRA